MNTAAPDKSTKEARKPVILIVDDDYNNLAVVRDCLMDCDYTLLVAEDGESAVTRADYARPDIILLDIMMPGIDGYETCRRLKVLESTKDIPVIFMSALAETGHKVKGLEVGAVDYITKPFQREELLARVAVHLHIRELTNSLQLANETLEKRVEERTIDLAVANEELEQEIAERQVAQEQLEDKIHELQKTQEALQKSEQKFRAIFDQTFQLMGVLDPKGKLLEVNQTALNICGVTEADIIGKPFWEGPWWTYSKELRDNVRDAVTKAAAGEFVRFEANYYQAGDNKLCYMDFSVKPILDDQGNVMLLIHEGRDITALKNLEKELRQAQKMEALGTLAAGIAHDFNNILMAIIGFTEMSLQQLDDESPVTKKLKQVHTAGMRASELVNQILTFTRQSEQEMKPLSLAVVVREVFQLLRSSLPATIEFQQEIPDSDSECMIMADPTQMHQVLMNLGTNASHAMRNQGGVLSVTLDHVQLDEAFVSRHQDLKAGEYLRLSLSDTGRGMSPAVMERIFDPYFTTKKVGEGTGLGLSVAMGIIRNHGGAITVSSKLAKGTTFQVFLPLIRKMTVAKEKPVNPLPTGTERILFIDDEQALANLGQEMLEKLGYKVSSMHNSIQALELFRQDPQLFDLVITDMTMPGITGVDLARQIAAIRADIPIMLCTGYNNMEHQSELANLIFCEWIQKPYVMSALAKTVRKALDWTIAQARDKSSNDQETFISS